jgi:hypothetical protein
MYDTATLQAWLADGASALLHVARTQVTQGPYGGESSLFNDSKYNAKKFVHPLPSGGSKAALCALKDERNLKHKILREFDSYADEKTPLNHIAFDTVDPSKAASEDESQQPNGGIEEIYKTTSFRELVSQTWSTFEQIYDRQKEDSTSHGFQQLQNPFKEVLQGYEFMGLVTAKRDLTPRAITLQGGGQTWLPLIQRTHAIVLFGKNFGDLYRSTALAMPRICKQWKTVPRGQYYLTSPVSLLKAIRQNSIEEGEIDEHSNDITEGFSWVPSKEAFKRCGPNCTHTILGRVQQPFKKGKQRLETAMFGACSPDSAVIFGDSSILNIHKMQQPTLTVAQPDGDMHDSGLGTSIETSSKVRTTDPTWADPDSDLRASQTTPPELDTSPSSSDIIESETSAPSNVNSGAHQALPINSQPHRAQDFAAQPNIRPTSPTVPISLKPKRPRGSLSVVWRKFTVAVRRHRSGSSGHQYSA